MIIGYTTNAAALRPLMNLLDGYLMTAAEVGEHLRYSTERLAHLRKDGAGPPYIKLPTGGVRYSMAEVTAWQLAGETGPLSLDRVAVAVAACLAVPAEHRATLIQHLEKAWPPMVREADTMPSTRVAQARNVRPVPNANPTGRRRGRPRKWD